MSFTVPALAGRWVRLEPLAEEHRAGLRAASDDDRVWQFMPSGGRGAEFDPWFDDALAQRDAGKRFPFAVRLLSSGELVGGTSYIEPVPQHRRVEIGWTWYRPDQWSGPVNPECKLLLLSHAFDECDVIAVEFRTHWHNRQSRAAIERLGARQDGVLRNHRVGPDGSLRDTVVYSILPHEWPAVRRGLQARLDRS